MEKLTMNNAKLSRAVNDFINENPEYNFVDIEREAGLSRGYIDCLARRRHLVMRTKFNQPIRDALKRLENKKALINHARRRDDALPLEETTAKPGQLSPGPRWTLALDCCERCNGTRKQVDGWVRQHCPNDLKVKRGGRVWIHDSAIPRMELFARSHNWNGSPKYVKGFARPECRSYAASRKQPEEPQQQRGFWVRLALAWRLITRGNTAA